MQYILWFMASALALFLTACPDHSPINTKPMDATVPTPDATRGDVTDAGMGDATDAAVADTTVADLLPQDRVGSDLADAGPLLGRVRVLHNLAWPGKGMGLTVVAENAAGNPQTDLVSADWSLAGPGGTSIPVAAKPADLSPAATLLLIDGVLASDTRAHLESFVSSRPEGEWIGLYQRCHRLHQVAGFSRQPNRLLHALRSMSGCSTGQPQPLDQTLEQAVEAALEITGPANARLRSVVLVADSIAAIPAQPLDPNHAVRVYAVAGEVPSPESWAANHIEVLEFRPWGGALGALTQLARIWTSTAQAAWTIGACPNLDVDTTLRLNVESPAQRLTANILVAVPEGAPEIEADTCTRSDIADNNWNYPNLIRFEMTTAQRQVYDQYVADKNTADDFDLSIRIGESEAIAATAHLRGQNSRHCQRKSYNVNLQQNEGRRFSRDMYTDEFLLVAMCMDNRYINEYIGNLLAAKLGLFPIEFRYIELRIDGLSKGVYLLLEKPWESLIEDISRMQVIVRRRLNWQPVEVKFPSDTANTAPIMDPFWELMDVIDNTPEEQLIEQLRLRSNIDTFLKWVALQTMMGNGDYVDEVFFYSAETLISGQQAQWFEVMGWDMDDLFSACHYNGDHAMVDPNGLVYCAEGPFEKEVLGTAAGYDHYVNLFEHMLLHELTDEVVEEVLSKTSRDLLPYFADANVCSAMVELLNSNAAATDPQVAQADLETHIDLMRQRFVAKRVELLDKINAYRGGE